MRWVFPKIMVPPNHPFVHRVFHYKPSILGGTPYFWKHPDMFGSFSFWGGWGHVRLCRWQTWPGPCKLQCRRVGLGDHEGSQLEIGWQTWMVFHTTLPETNIFAPENRPFAPKGNEKVFQPSIFRGENVSFREGIFLYISIFNQKKWSRMKKTLHGF